jgi:hypothetical protein
MTKAGGHTRATDEDTVSLIRRLAEHYDDQTVGAAADGGQHGGPFQAGHYADNLGRPCTPRTHDGTQPSGRDRQRAAAVGGGPHHPCLIITDHCPSR